MKGLRERLLLRMEDHDLRAAVERQRRERGHAAYLEVMAECRPGGNPVALCISRSQELDVYGMDATLAALSNVAARLSKVERRLGMVSK